MRSKKSKVVIESFLIEILLGKSAAKNLDMNEEEEEENVGKRGVKVKFNFDDKIFKDRHFLERRLGVSRPPSK
jgi:hypothetical protein